MRKLFVLAVALAAVVALVPALAPAQKGPIKIGLLMSFSGVVAAWGRAGRQGL